MRINCFLSFSLPKFDFVVFFSRKLFFMGLLGKKDFMWFYLQRSVFRGVSHSVNSIFAFVVLWKIFLAFPMTKIVFDGLLIIERWFLHSSNQFKLLFRDAQATCIQVPSAITFFMENLSTTVFPWRFVRRKFWFSLSFDRWQIVPRVTHR